MRRTIPHAEVKVWADCGHVPQIEHPERTLTAMLSFFDRLGPGDAADLRTASAR